MARINAGTKEFLSSELDKGVDLNRNFPYMFNGGEDPCSEDYGGTEPFSEAETKAFRDFIQDHN